MVLIFFFNIAYIHSILLQTQRMMWNKVPRKRIDLPLMRLFLCIAETATRRCTAVATPIPDKASICWNLTIPIPCGVQRRYTTEFTIADNFSRNGGEFSVWEILVVYFFFLACCQMWYSVPCFTMDSMKLRLFHK